MRKNVIIDVAKFNIGLHRTDITFSFFLNIRLALYTVWIGIYLLLCCC